MLTALRKAAKRHHVIFQKSLERYTYLLLVMRVESVWIGKHQKLIKISWNLRLFPRQAAEKELEIRRHYSQKIKYKYRWCYVKL